MQKTKKLIKDLCRNGLLTDYICQVCLEDEEFLEEYKFNLSKSNNDTINVFYQTLLKEHYSHVLNKSDFWDIINSLKSIDELKSTVKKELQLIGNNFNIECQDPSFSNAIHETIILKLLKVMFNDKSDDIDYFIYELNYGSKENSSECYIIDGVNVPLSNAWELYDLLVVKIYWSNKHIASQKEK